MNEGDSATGIDTVANCPVGGSATVIHNSHITVGGAKPHIRKTPCLFGKGEQFAAFSGPTVANPALLQRAFIASKVSGLISVVTADPADGANRWSALIPIDLCDRAKEVCDASPFTPNASAPTAIFWSQVTGKVYSYLSGYQSVAEIDPAALAVTRRFEIAVPLPDTTVFQSVGMTPDGRFLFLVGEDVNSDSTKVIGKFGVVDLNASPLSVTTFSIPELENIRPARFLFTPNGTRLYLTQSNSTTGLTAQQADSLKKDKLLAFDPSTLPVAPVFVGETPLPAADMHAMDLWITGPQGAGSAKGVVVTNATPGVNGSVSLIDAASNTITATIPVGRNPKQATVYYVGLAASDNQATPR
jgi:YVTN family beta-propeller protein